MHIIEVMSLIKKSQSSENNKHSCNVSSVICHNDFVITGSDDGKIKEKIVEVGTLTTVLQILDQGFVLQVWKPNLELVSEFEGSGAILSLAACDNNLYACTTANAIQSWDLNGMKLIGDVPSTLFQPQKLYAEKANKLLWAGDSQGNVAKFERGKECGKYELVEEIWDVMVSGNPPYIYTARDRDVVVAEIMTGSAGTRVFVKKTLQGRSPICIAGNRLCFLDRDGRKVLIHENSVEKNFIHLNELPASDLIINAMASASDNVIYTGGYDSTAKKWDLGSSKCMGSINLNACINAIATLSENEAYIARSDGIVSQIGV